VIEKLATGYPVQLICAGLDFPRSSYYYQPSPRDDAALKAALQGVVAGVYVYPILRNKAQGYPYETEIEKGLLPLIYQAICAAYKLSEQSAQAGESLLDGVPKAAVADCLYYLLPNVIGGIPVGIVKTWVSQPQFAQLVERVYLDFDFDYHTWLENMDKAFASWKQANQPA
jgi:hypothetical protein